MSLSLEQDQIEGVNFIMSSLSNHKGCYLADIMGYGKTAQAIAVLKQALNKGPVLIISPAYICYNWVLELEKWGVDLNQVQRIESTKDKLNNSLKIFIVSYNMATNKEIFKQLFNLYFSLIICDESHYLKTWNSNRSKLILGTYKNKKTNLLQRTHKVLCLSGTPILNRVEELYNVLVRIAPNAINMTKDNFIVYFSKHVDYTPWGIKARGVKNEKELKERIKPVFLSRQKIKGLTGRTDKKIMLEVKGKEIEDFLKQEKEWLQENNINNAEDLIKLTKLDASVLSDLRQKIALIKIPKVLECLPDILEQGKKPIIYCYHRLPQEEIYKQIKKKYPDLKVDMINGSVSNNKRVEIIQNFDILIATIGALKEGVNITHSNTQIFFELDWTPGNIEQAIARIWRKGQTDNVKIWFFLFNGGIDKYISKMLDDKSDMIRRVIE